MTARARSRFDPAPIEPHHFQPDGRDYGYRPRCRQCQREEMQHPHLRPAVPSPRRPA